MIGGAFAGLLLVGYQRLVLARTARAACSTRSPSATLPLSLGLVALAAMIDVRAVRKVLWPAIGALAGLAGVDHDRHPRRLARRWRCAACCSSSYGHVLSNRRVRAVVALTFVLMAATYFVPETGVRERVRQGVADVTTYFGGGSAFTNVGVRLELWKAAGMLIEDAPLLGAQRGELPQGPRAPMVRAGRARSGGADDAALS